jgi:thiamine biosynthesis lipoprotein
MAGCLPARAFAGDVRQWQGVAMGTQARILLSGHAGSSYPIFRRIEQIIAGVEATCSLYVDSELSRLNATGLLRHPSRDMADLIALCDRVYAATQTAFDPTVQPLWLALARGDDGARQRDLIGWRRVKISADGIELPRDFQLTLNGIAQGFCADKVAAFLRNEGFDHVLVDTGELHAIGPQRGGEAWPVTISGEDGETLRHALLANRALATSSPRGTKLARGEAHILGPQGQPPRWNTVSISAPSAAVADALSTASCLMPREAITHALSQFPDARIEAII